MTRLTDLVDFIDVEDATLGSLDVKIGSVEQFEQQILHVFTDVTSLSQSGGIADCKGNVENLCQCSSQQSLSAAGWPKEKNIGFVDLDVGSFVAEHQALVMTVHSHG